MRRKYWEEILHSKDVQSVRFHADGMSPIPTTQGWNAKEKTKEPGLEMRTEKTTSASALSAQTPSEDKVNGQLIRLPA